ncbi:OppA family ABC transporter substrate-binding lipoprotein [Mycoplasmopsis opalescens]|uniref:OppA family ABC transporter substrate-binding lipoprotein n=1 Tax=Mycoplasmopsis opalescens TaxID=114886 RepID=UPI0004A72C8C|nr:hypothetical protein [Mycoplasmopsis opalescens]
MHKKINLSIVPLISIFPLVSSCNKNDFNIDKYHYIEKNNYANDYGKYGYLIDNHISTNINKINLSTSAKLFRISSQKQPIIDFRDNIVIRPSELKYKFEGVKSITINSANNSVKYDNDAIDEVDYSGNSIQPGVFTPKKNIGNGFNLPFLFVPSSKLTSINNKNFKKNLTSTSYLEIDIATKRNIWVDKNGKLLHDNNVLNHKSYKLGLLSKMLRHSSFRQIFASQNNINLDKINIIKMNLEHSFDLYNYLIQNDIDVEKLLDFENDKIILRTKSGKDINMEPIFDFLFIDQNFFDALPYEYIAKRYNNPTKSIEWYYQYGQNLDNLYFAGYYYINKLNSDITKLKINKNYSDDASSLREITLQYNSLPISPSTFSLQSLNAFRQNIISKIDYEKLELDEKNFILGNYQNYNFSYSQEYNKLHLTNKIIVNHNPNINTKYINKQFFELYYGLENETIDLKPKNLTFQSLFNNLINHFSLINENENVWLSQAPKNSLITAKNKGINISELKDAYNQVNKPIIFDKNNKKIKDIFQYQNKDKLNNPHVINVEEKIKSAWYEVIHKNLNSIINEYLNSTNKIENIYFNIPVIVNNYNHSTNIKIGLITKILNSIHQKLKVDITIIDDYAKYKEFFLQNNSIYKEAPFYLHEGTTAEYVFEQLNAHQNNIFQILKAIDNNINLYQESYKNLVDLIIFIKSLNVFNNQNNLEQNKNKIIYYLTNLTVEQQLSLINELNNLISYTLNFNNKVKLNTYDKVIYQKHLIKPLSWNNLEFFQDVTINNG